MSIYRQHKLGLKSYFRREGGKGGGEEREKGGEERESGRGKGKGREYETEK